MADEEILVSIKIDSKEAKLSLSELKALYEQQKKDLKDLEEGSAEYIKKLKEFNEVEKAIGSFGKSLKDLKEEYKEGQKELSKLVVGSKEYTEQLKKLGSIKDEIGDLNTTIKAFSPDAKVQAFTNVIGGLASGFQAAQGAAALFGKSGEDIQKVLLKVQAASALSEGIKGIQGLTDGFRDLGLVLKANPIILFATIIVTIGAALYALKDKIGIVGEAFDVIGKTIGFVTDKIKAFTDWIGISDFAQNKLAQSIIDNSQKIKEANNSRYDSEIAAAKRAGKETELIEIAKLSAITKTNDEAIKQLLLRKQVSGELSDDDKKKLAELRDENKKAYQDILNLSDAYKDREIANNAKINEEWKKKQDEKKAKLDEYNKWADSEYKKLLAQQEANDAKELENTQSLIDRKNQLYKSDLQNKYEADLAKLESDYNTSNQNAEAYSAYLELKQKIDYDYETAKQQAADEASAKNQARLDAEVEASKKAAEDKRNAELEIAQQLNNGLQSLSNLYFTTKKNNLKKGSAEEKKAAKEQFEVNKKLQLAGAIISGIQNAITAYGAGLKAASATGVGAAAAPAWGALYAGISIIGSLANIAKISATKFESTSGGADTGGSGSAPSASAGVAVNSPTSSSTLLNADGTIKGTTSNQLPTQKVVVVESDITDRQKRVAQLEENAKI